MSSGPGAAAQEQQSEHRHKRWQWRREKRRKRRVRARKNEYMRDVTCGRESMVACVGEGLRGVCAQVQACLCVAYMNV